MAGRIIDINMFKRIEHLSAINYVFMTLTNSFRLNIENSIKIEFNE